MPTIATYQLEATSLSLEDFVRKHPAPILLPASKLRSDDSQKKDAFRTRAIQPRLDVPLGVPEPEADVFVIAKDTASTFSTRISIGRSKSNDVCIGLSGVSKFHAYIDTTGAPEIYAIADGGSTNGTFVNAQQVAPRTPVPLPSGSAVQFGPHRFIFLVSQAFYTLMRRGNLGKSTSQNRPVRRPPAPSEITQKTEVTLIPKALTNKPSLLIVNTVGTFSNALHMLLGQHFTLHTSSSPLGALKDIQTLKPNALLLGHRMPERDRTWLRKEIERLEQDAPVILNDAAETIDGFLEDSDQALGDKLLGMTMLVATIHEVLDNTGTKR